MADSPIHFVFLKTSTVEKIAHYQMIADALHLPIAFIDVRDIAGTQHATDEFEGSVEGNANAKFVEFGTIPQRMQATGDPLHDNVLEICKKYDTEYDPKRIHVAVDDFEWGIDKISDKSLAETDGFKRYVDKHTLTRAINAPTFPGPELAPFISAMSGNSTLVQGIKTGAKELLGDDVKTVPSSVSVVFQYQSLAHLKDEPQKLDGTTALVFDVQKPVKPDDAVKEHITTMDGISGGNPDFFLLKHPRTQIIEAFASKLGIEPAHQWKRKIKTTEPFAVSNTMMTGDALLASDRRKESFLQRMRKSNHEGNGTDIIDFAAQMTDNLRKADEILAKSDALLFLPPLKHRAQQDNDQLDITAIARQFMLSSCVVAKQLNLRDSYKPLIVLNLKDEAGKGAYDRDFEIFDHLVQSGMLKDYTLGLDQIKPAGIENDDVNLRRTLYFDVLEGVDLGQLNDARDKLLDHYRETYYRPPALVTQNNEDLGGRQQFEEAVAKGEGLFKVGVFLSAGSENLQLNNDTKAFGKWLAENEFGVVFGGGDRYLMGSLHEGYHEGKTAGQRTFEAGFSTPEIVKSETKLGKLPDDLDVAILNQDIYERMGQMIALTDDAIIIRPGGAGTVQEMAAILLMKEVYKDVPEIARKKIIIQNPPLIDGQDPFYDPVLERLFGDKYKTLKAESRPGSDRILSKKLGIYVADNDEEIQSLLGEFKGEWQRRQAASAATLETPLYVAKR